MLDQSAQDRIWDAFQSDSAESFAGNRGRLAYLARLVRSQGRVLNIGVGGGQFEEEALARGIEVYSLDPSQRAIDELRKRLGLAPERAKVGHAQQIPFADGSFGAVVASELLEHLEPADVPIVLAEISRVLSPGGLLVGTVPARESLADKRSFAPIAASSSIAGAIAKHSTRASSVRVLSANFAIVRLFETPFINWRTLNWKGRLVAATKLLLWRVGIHGSGESLVFVARRPWSGCPASPSKV